MGETGRNENAFENWFSRLHSDYCCMGGGQCDWKYGGQGYSSQLYEQATNGTFA
jgi:hypothetical protein